MDFKNALTMMDQGVNMTRLKWADPEAYVVLDHKLYKRNMKLGTNRVMLPISFRSSDVSATDWEVTRST